MSDSNEISGDIPEQLRADLGIEHDPKPAEDPLPHIPAEAVCGFVVLLDHDGRWICDSHVTEVAAKTTFKRDSDIGDFVVGGAAVSRDADRIAVLNAICGNVPGLTVQQLMAAQMEMARRAAEQQQSQDLANRIFRPGQPGR